ncbi:hypothetical protein C7271_26310 [filamentous cyanobacterium CCP5]|nr:hypothetical protein C7271_26310 [filamentous cyanobacterium CCP5]PSN12116.1 hypothetical protein C7293_21540 [filamentous cyanobacterium CCT1]PSN76607.1 hypothetical protein C8B47_26425 [filamentous cyanobacterium CCP4]
MESIRRQVWLNFLTLLPATGLTILTIAVAFLRFYDEQDFGFLELVAQPRIWSNRLTVAALLAALANFGVEWNRRNRETDRLAEEAQRRAEEEQRRAEEVQRKAEEEQRRVREEQRRVREEQRNAEAERQRLEERERATRRAAIQNRWIVLQTRHQLTPSEQTQAALEDFLLFLQEYGD